jgi:hypothetical protein
MLPHTPTSALHLTPHTRRDPQPSHNTTTHPPQTSHTPSSRTLSAPHTHHAIQPHTYSNVVSDVKCCTAPAIAAPPSTQRPLSPKLTYTTRHHTTRHTPNHTTHPTPPSANTHTYTYTPTPLRIHSRIHNTSHPPDHHTPQPHTYTHAIIMPASTHPSRPLISLTTHTSPLSPRTAPPQAHPPPSHTSSSLTLPAPHTHHAIHPHTYSNVVSDVRCCTAPTISAPFFWALSLLVLKLTHTNHRPVTYTCKTTVRKHPHILHRLRIHTRPCTSLTTTHLSNGTHACHHAFITSAHISTPTQQRPKPQLINQHRPTVMIDGSCNGSMCSPQMVDVRGTLKCFKEWHQLESRPFQPNLSHCWTTSSQSLA